MLSFVKQAGSKLPFPVIERKFVFAAFVDYVHTSYDIRRGREVQMESI